MAGAPLAKLLLCVIAQTTHCHPNLFYVISNPQITVIRCSTDFLWRYGIICLKFPMQWNTTNPSPAPPTQTPAQPPEETPPSSTPGEEAAPTSSLVEIDYPAASAAGGGRLRRGIHLGPEFSLALPPLKPPLTFNFPPLGQTPPAQPTTIVVVPGR